MDFMTRLLASDWTKEEVAEYYNLREDMTVSPPFLINYGLQQVTRLTF